MKNWIKDLEKRMRKNKEKYPDDFEEWIYEECEKLIAEVVSQEKENLRLIGINQQLEIELVEIRRIKNAE